MVRTRINDSVWCLTIYEKQLNCEKSRCKQKNLKSDIDHECELPMLNERSYRWRTKRDEVEAKRVTKMHWHLVNSDIVEYSVKEHEK